MGERKGKGMVQRREEEGSGRERWEEDEGAHCHATSEPKPRSKNWELWGST